MRRFQIASLFIIVVAGVIALLSRYENSSIAISDYNFMPRLDSQFYVSHSYYSLTYNEDNEQPDWVAYTIIPDQLESLVERPSYFRVDTLVSTGTSNQNDYYKSGYDRGHLVPAADMQFDSLAIAETFLYSNISPQLPGYNRGIWKRLEQYTRDISTNFDSILVITGPVIGSEPGHIGENLVSVPASFYKIIIQYFKNDVSVLAYLIPHLEGLKDLSKYIVAIDSIESITGIDFLYDLPDRMEERLER